MLSHRRYSVSLPTETIISPLRLRRTYVRRDGAGTTSTAEVESADMLSLSDSGIVVICYFSAGTYEEYRDDEADFPRSALGNRVEYYFGSWWININDEVRRRDYWSVVRSIWRVVGWLHSVSLPNAQRSKWKYLWKMWRMLLFLELRAISLSRAFRFSVWCAGTRWIIDINGEVRRRRDYCSFSSLQQQHGQQNTSPSTVVLSRYLELAVFLLLHVVSYQRQLHMLRLRYFPKLVVYLFLYLYFLNTPTSRTTTTHPL